MSSHSQSAVSRSASRVPIPGSRMPSPFQSIPQPRTQISIGSPISDPQDVSFGQVLVPTIHRQRASSGPATYSDTTTMNEGGFRHPCAHCAFARPSCALCSSARSFCASCAFACLSTPVLATPGSRGDRGSSSHAPSSGRRLPLREAFTGLAFVR